MRFLLNWRKKEYEQSIRIGKTLYRYSLNSFCWLNIVLNYLKIRLLVSSMKYVNVIHCFQSVQEDMVVYLGHNFFLENMCARLNFYINALGVSYSCHYFDLYSWCYSKIILSLFCLYSNDAPIYLLITKIIWPKWQGWFYTRQ